MRRFRDRTGMLWDVVLGRESWGASVALFVPDGEGRVRQSALKSVAYDAAIRELDTMDEIELQTLLDRSTPKEDTAG